MAEELTEKLIGKVREYVFLYDTCHPEYKNLVKKAEALISCIHHRLLFLLQHSAKKRSSSSSELDIVNQRKTTRDENKRKLLCSHN